MTLLHMGRQSILSIVFPRTLSALEDLAAGTFNRVRYCLTVLCLCAIICMFPLHVQQQIRFPHKLEATCRTLELLLQIVTLYSFVVGNEIRRNTLKDALITTLFYPFQSMHRLLVLMQFIFSHTTQLAHAAGVVCRCVRWLGLIIRFRVLQVKFIAQFVGDRVVEH